jgi:hypothetical protein
VTSLDAPALAVRLGAPGASSSSNLLAGPVCWTGRCRGLSRGLDVSIVATEQPCEKTAAIQERARELYSNGVPREQIYHTLIEQNRRVDCPLPFLDMADAIAAVLPDLPKRPPKPLVTPLCEVLSRQRDRTEREEHARRRRAREAFDDRVRDVLAADLPAAFDVLHDRAHAQGGD